MRSQEVRLRLRADVTRFESTDGEGVELPVGLADLTRRVLRHDPPTGAELEHAIDQIEDALAHWPDARPAGGSLVVTHAKWRALPGLDRPEAALGRDDVEALFQRLASRALGTPVSADELPHGAEAATALLVLREVMHHLGFERVTARVE